MSSSSSLDRPERHRNPIQKAVSGVRNMLRNLTGPSPTTTAGLHRRLSLEDDRDPGTDRRTRQAQAAPPVVRQRTRANSESRIPNGNSERSATLTKQQWNTALPTGRPPGVTGIHNHGNSCFLNAVIQCLSNTDLLMEYLLSNELKDGIERSDQNCAVTRQLMALIESLWTGTYDAEISYSFKQTVGECAEQYSGMTQNDAQEFLLWLLDKVNEELCYLVEKDVSENEMCEILSSKCLLIFMSFVLSQVRSFPNNSDYRYILLLADLHYCVSFWEIISYTLMPNIEKRI